MKIALLGGTGDLGKGLACRWSLNHQVIVGSRSEEKSRTIATQYKDEVLKYFSDRVNCSLEGAENSVAVRGADLVLMTVPHEHIVAVAKQIGNALKSGSIMVSPVVPMRKVGKYFAYIPEFGDGEVVRKPSAAEVIAEIIPQVKVVSAFHSMPAAKLANLSVALEFDVLMAGDDRIAIDKVSSLVREIPNLRPLYAGPLQVSSLLESLTPLMLNLSIHGHIKEPSVKIVQ